MIGAHTDEVGLIVTYINENGTMKLAPVGGIDPSVVIGRAVQVGEQRIPVSLVQSRFTCFQKKTAKSTIFL